MEFDAEDALTLSLHSNRPGYYPNVAAYEKHFPGGEKVLALNDAHAVACLPLVSSAGHVIGAIGYTFRTEQVFDEQQRSLLETVADVAAQSLDRAQLYERERDVASALQMALLPSALPELDGVITEARYVAGGAGVSVGGDWYDVLRFNDGRVGLLIGDAAGRGVEAATLMGKVRHAAAAVAMDHQSPATVLARVNEYLHTISLRRDMVTCCYIVLDRDRGTLRYSSAGHPPPVIVEDDGVPQFLNGARGVPLGVIPTAVYAEATYQLRSAATVVLYTDGLIERRGETIDVGLARLLDTVRGNDLDVRHLCDHLSGTLLTKSSDDDVALLATRVCSIPGTNRLDLELPADSRRLHELRTRVGRWLADAGVEPALIPEVVIALNEAASNSMVHAYAGSRHRGHVRVSLALVNSTLTATVADEGSWREPGAGHDGRGIEMMQALMGDVRVERGEHGTRVQLTRVITS
jgi:serine phosphatase RsbU (regulator of sigma subunit)/anti-sigma regulatory factor (Ser/Thr protein kinase)